MPTTRTVGVIFGLLFTAGSLGCADSTPPAQDPSSVEENDSENASSDQGSEGNRQVNGVLDPNRPSSSVGVSSQRHSGSKEPGAACLSDGECASGSCGRCSTGAATCYCN
jgi:hypothetical protein